jgi:hypothetical protein
MQQFQRDAAAYGGCFLETCGKRLRRPRIYSRNEVHLADGAYFERGRIEEPLKL